MICVTLGCRFLSRNRVTPFRHPPPQRPSSARRKERGQLMSRHSRNSPRSRRNSRPPSCSGRLGPRNSLHLGQLSLRQPDFSPLNSLYSLPLPIDSRHPSSDRQRISSQMSRISSLSRHMFRVSLQNLRFFRHNRPLSRHPHTTSRTSSRRIAASIHAAAAMGQEDSSPPRAARSVASRASRRAAQVVRPAVASRAAVARRRSG